MLFINQIQENRNYEFSYVFAGNWVSEKSAITEILYHFSLLSVIIVARIFVCDCQNNFFIERHINNHISLMTYCSLSAKSLKVFCKEFS